LAEGFYKDELTFPTQWIL